MDYSNQTVHRVMNRLTVAAPFSYKSHACIGKFISLQLFFWQETKLLFFCYSRDGYLWGLLPPRKSILYAAHGQNKIAQPASKCTIVPQIHIEQNTSL